MPGGRGKWKGCAWGFPLDGPVAQLCVSVAQVGLGLNWWFGLSALLVWLAIWVDFGVGRRSQAARAAQRLRLKAMAARVIWALALARPR